MPSVIKTLPAWWRNTLLTGGMRLGLDLQGGMHLILKVNLPRAVQHHLEVAITDLRAMLRKQQIATGPPESTGVGRVRLSLTQPDTAATVKQMVQEEFRNLEVVAEGNS